MSIGAKKLTRPTRVMSFKSQPGRLSRLWDRARSGDVMLRLGLALVTAISLWGVTRAWAPPFAHRVDDVLTEDISVEYREDDNGEPQIIPISAGQPLTLEQIKMLSRDYADSIARLPRMSAFVRSLAAFGLIFGLFALCGYFMYHQDRRMLKDLRRFSTLLGLTVLTCAMARIAWPYPWRARRSAPEPTACFSRSIPTPIGRCATVPTVSSSRSSNATFPGF